MEHPVSQHVETETNPGSFNDFAERYPQLSHVELVREHSEALHVHALTLAAKANMTLEDLRDRTTDYNSIVR